MSYDIYFRRLALRPCEEDPEDVDYTEADLAAWDRLIPLVRAALGEIDVFEGPPSWEISHVPTGLQVSLFEGQWTVTVPYWTRGEGAAFTLRTLYRIAKIVARETGTYGFDPQLAQQISQVIDPASAGRPFFDKVAQQFGDIY